MAITKTIGSASLQRVGSGESVNDGGAYSVIFTIQCTNDAEISNIDNIYVTLEGTLFSGTADEKDFFISQVLTEINSLTENGTIDLEETSLDSTETFVADDITITTVTVLYTEA